MATPTATFLGLMATALSAQERELLDSMSSDLRFTLSEFEIHDRIQLRAVELGYKSLALFAALGDDRPSVRAVIATDFFLNAQEPNLDADLALQARLSSTQILAAWLSASTRATEESKQSADNRLLRLPADVRSEQPSLPPPPPPAALTAAEILEALERDIAAIVEADAQAEGEDEGGLLPIPPPPSTLHAAQPEENFWRLVAGHRELLADLRGRQEQRQRQKRREERDRQAADSSGTATATTTER